ncbi:MAG: DUF433 domain-containing protein [Planctomycetaceae bacterium]
MASIEIIDRGRGPQLSTTRITVHDLVPYFQQGCSCDEIIHWIPTLSCEEVAVAEAYYRAHREELDEEDRRIRERIEEEARKQREQDPLANETREERLRRMRQLLESRRESHRAGHPG